MKRLPRKEKKKLKKLIKSLNLNFKKGFKNLLLYGIEIYHVNNVKTYVIDLTKL